MPLYSFKDGSRVVNFDAPDDDSAALMLKKHLEHESELEELRLWFAQFKPKVTRDGQALS